MRVHPRARGEVAKAHVEAYDGDSGQGERNVEAKGSWGVGLVRKVCLVSYGCFSWCENPSLGGGSKGTYRGEIHSLSIGEIVVILSQSSILCGSDIDGGIHQTKNLGTQRIHVSSRPHPFHEMRYDGC